MVSSTPDAKSEASLLAGNFAEIRKQSLKIVEPLAADDYMIQSAEFVSPPKWHLAHTTWFFETFLLKPSLPGYRELDARYGELFNSYYKSLGEHPDRAHRGAIICRPTLKEVLHYREYVESAMARLFETTQDPRTYSLARLGLNHEQQHQELLMMDIKHIYFSSPLFPAYQKTPEIRRLPDALEYLSIPGGLREIGHSGPRFSFDNELPRHQAYVPAFQIADRLVSNAEFVEFIRDEGYRRPELWLSDGWDWAQRAHIDSPLYWHHVDGRWNEFTLGGDALVQADAPVCHVSFYEADAYARWKQMRLPTEQEWETMAVETGRRFPDEAWNWTASAYLPYPGATTSCDAMGEYNFKFMCNQMVLRGGAGVTPPNHYRPTYRNYFAPEMRWQYSGFRLAKDLQ